MRRQKTLIGLLVVVSLIGILALIRSQPWGRIYWRLGFLKPNTKDWIACIQLRESQGDLVMIKPTGEKLALTQDEADDRSPDWSPDGGRLIFSSNRKEEVYQLFLIDPDGHNLNQLTIGGGAKLEPEYRLDGRHILHVAQGLITEIDSKGIHAEQLVPPPMLLRQWQENLGSFTFRYARGSVEEALIAAVQVLDFGEAAIWYHIEPEIQAQKPPVLILTGKQVDLDWSPTEPKLVVAVVLSELEAGSGKPKRALNILTVLDFSQDLKKPAVVPLWSAPGASEAAIQPIWSPDGNQIAYVRCRVEKGGHLVRTGLMTIPADGGVPTEIAAGEIYDPDWAPDSKRLVFAMGPPGKRQIYTVQIDGTGLKQWTREGDYRTPKWSPRR